MRRPICIILGATLALTGIAQATTFKSDGASSAGICAAALDLAADFKSRRGTAQPQELENMQRARDFFAEMPNFDRNEIAANAEAFVRLMTQRMAVATTPEKRAAITREIGKVSKGCFDTAVRMVAENPQLTMPPLAQPVQPQPAQPYVAQPQPYVTQPQPLESQPLIINPQ